MDISYQQAFCILSENEQIAVKNLHHEEAMKIQEKIVSLVQSLHELWCTKREQQVVDFLVNWPNENISQNALVVLSDSIIQTLCSPVDFLDITPRSSNCFKAQSVRFIGDLCTLDEEMLLRTPNLWRKSVSEIKRTLKEHWLMLGMNIPNWDELRPKE